MKGIFEANLKVLEKDYLTLARRCESFYRENGENLEQILCEKTKNDLLNFKVNINGHKFFLHSPYDPIKEAKNWVSRIDLKSVDTLAVLGVGVGYHLEELFNAYPTKNKVIIEPDISVFVKLMTMRDISHLITAKNTLFIVSDNTEYIAKVFLGLREDGQIDTVHFEELLSYRTAYDEWWTSLKKDFIKYSKLHGININTGVVFSKDWIENFFENIVQLVESVNLDSYESKLKGIPAVIVSAGPSLNKNVHLLNSIKDKAVILSAGSSINILEKNGVKPHIMVGVDGGELESRIFNNVKATDIYFAYSSSIHYDGLKNYKGPKLYFKTNVLEYTSWFEKEMDMNTKDLRSGASVSNLALDIARLMGCDPIILVGQDLSYTNLQSYADGAVLKNEQDEILKKNIEEMNKHYLKEKDIYGNTVYTIPPMISMKIYFEEYVKLYPKVTFINGSEGGLPIKGMPNKPLSEIIDEYCQNKFNIDNILEEIYRNEISVNSNKMDKIRSFLDKVYTESEDMKDKALKRMDIILDILRNINADNSKKWNEIEELTGDIEKYDLFKFFIEPICKYFIQAIKNERERKSETIDNIEEKKRYLYEGLLMQYTDIKDKIIQINELSGKILNEIK